MEQKNITNSLTCARRESLYLHQYVKIVGGKDIQGHVHVKGMRGYVVSVNEENSTLQAALYGTTAGPRLIPLDQVKLDCFGEQVAIVHGRWQGRLGMVLDTFEETKTSFVVEFCEPRPAGLEQTVCRELHEGDFTVVKPGYVHQLSS